MRPRMDGRRKRYVPLDVYTAFGKTGTRLLDKWGLEGLCVWHLLLAASKREPEQGTFTFATDEEAWSKLGATATKFSLDEFLTFTGRIKQTRRTRIGRVQNVKITGWGQWNNAYDRQIEAEGKSRKRAQNTPDNTPTLPGRYPDNAPTEYEVEVELEGEKGRGSLVRDVLPFEKQQKIDKLVRWCGDHADSRTESLLESRAIGLPEGPLAKVLESCLAARDVRNRAGYALRALDSELAEGAA